MNFEILIKTLHTELPELKPGQFRYVLGRDGLHVERATPMYTSSVKVDGPVPFLAEHPQQCRLNCGPIPSNMLRQMVGFFQAAYHMHGGEAALVLLYFPATGKFAWHCPKQTIRMYSSWGKFRADDSVEYDNPLSLPAGAVQFGDAHSHIGPPIPSIMDQNDEAHLDGLHIIVGNISSRFPRWHIDFCIDGHRFSVPTDMILEAVPEAPFPEPPVGWTQQIQLVYPSWKTESYSASKPRTSTWSSSSHSRFGSSKNQNGSGSRDSVEENDESPPSASEKPAAESQPSDEDES